MKRRGSHWQPRDRKADVAQDIRDWVQASDPTAKMESLDKLTARDLTDLMLATREAEKTTQLLDSIRGLLAKR